LCKTDNNGDVGFRPSNVPSSCPPIDGTKAGYCAQDSSDCMWRVEEEIFACCTASVGDSKTPLVQEMCGNWLPDNTQGSNCVGYMVDLCKDHWDPLIDATCINYLNGFTANSDVPLVVQTTVKNYINSRAEQSKCGTNDYTSPLIDPNACRDDSKDSFISKTLITLCKTIAPGVSNCDELLDQYCESFTRDDLSKDPTLQTICGCHLATSTPASNAGLKLSRKPQGNQYDYPGMTQTCDPICAYSGTIQTNAPQCAQTVCIMDKISINEINSNCGDITINQVCGQAPSGGGVGNCYISNVDVDLINSDCGGVFLHQNCGACFTFDPSTEWNGSVPASAKKVDCANPNPPPPPGGNGGNGGNGSGNGGGGKTSSSFLEWIKSHLLFVGGGGFVLILFILFIFLMYHYS
jgi:hypothetical protein